MLFFSQCLLCNSIILISKTGCCIISRFNQTKFMGILLDDSLSWEYHLESRHVHVCTRKKICKDRAMSKLFIHFKLLKWLWHIYNTFILPYLSYCNSVYLTAYNKYLLPLIILHKTVYLIHDVFPFTHSVTMARHASVLFVGDSILYLHLNTCIVFKIQNNMFDNSLFCRVADVHS